MCAFVSWWKEVRAPTPRSRRPTRMHEKRSSFSRMFRREHGDKSSAWLVRLLMASLASCFPHRLRPLISSLISVTILIHTSAFKLPSPSKARYFGLNTRYQSSAADHLLDWIAHARETRQAVPLWGVHDALSAKIMHGAAAATPTAETSTNPSAAATSPGMMQSEGNMESSEWRAHTGLFISGFGVSASRLGVPDAGIISRPDIVDTTNNILLALSTPSTAIRENQAVGGNNRPPVVVVDGDTGFGGTANVRRTIHSLAALGAAGVTIEDQIFPKRCTYVAGSSVQVVSREQAQQRIRTAIQARDEAWEQRGQKLLIVGRTDCRNGAFIDGAKEALERCLLFQNAGADIVYAESLHSADEYQWLRKEIDDPKLPMMIAQVQQTVVSLLSTGEEQKQHKLPQKSPWTIDEIGEMGYELALFGVTALQATVAALQATARHVMHTGGVVKASHIAPTNSAEEGNAVPPPPPPLASLDEVKAIVGFPELDEFESEFGCT